ncbi:MAG: hypothetical protein RL073_24, partial [Actinomycetota bacterium]
YFFAIDEVIEGFHDTRLSSGLDMGYGYKQRCSWGENSWSS